MSHAVRVRTQVFAWTCFHFPGWFLGVELLGHVVSVWLAFGELADLLSEWPQHLHLHQPCTEVKFSNTCSRGCCCLSDHSHPKRFEGVPLCGFNLHFPTDRWCWTAFCVLIGHFSTFSEMSSLDLPVSEIRSTSHSAVTILYPWYQFFTKYMMSRCFFLVCDFVHCFFFGLMLLELCLRTLPNLGSWESFPVFSSWNFVVLALTSGSLVHFLLVFV